MVPRAVKCIQDLPNGTNAYIVYKQFYLEFPGEPAHFAVIEIRNTEMNSL